MGSRSKKSGIWEKISDKAQHFSNSFRIIDRPVNHKVFCSIFICLFMSPRTSQQFEEIRNQSQRKIVDAAFELFATRGYHNTSISQIAKTAGVAKGLIYNYFEKKEDLVLAIVSDLMSQGDDTLGDVLNIEDPKEQLKAIIELSFRYVTEREHDTKLMTALSLQLDDFPAVQEVVRGKYTGMIPLMAHLLEKAGIPDFEQEARMLAATMDGIGLQYIVLKETVPMEEMKQYLIQKYCS